MPDTLQVAMTGETDLTLVRDFAASPRQVWRAMTEPKLLTQWLWACDSPMTVCEQDFRVGGTLRWVWRMPSGTDMGLSGRYVEIEPPRRLVHTELFDEDWTGGETRVTTTLDEIAPQTTRMTMVIVYPSGAARAGAMQSAMAVGMEEGYARLDGLLPTFLSETSSSDFRIVADGPRSLVVTRSFAAPAWKVHKAHLDPALAKRWLGSEAFPIRSCQIDARPDGTFRYEWATPDGTPLVLSGTFAEITPTRIVHSERFEPDWTGGETQVTTDFTENDGRTTVRVAVVYSSTDARDAVAASGMAEGMSGSYDLMEALL